LSNASRENILAVIKDQRRKFHEADTLLRWMNGGISPNYWGKTTKASRERVLAIVEAINRATELLRVPTSSERDYIHNPPKAVQQALKEITDRLSRYPREPYVDIMRQYGKYELGFTYIPGGKAPWGERIAVSQLINLAETERFSLLRQCQCQKWFLARRADQKACSPNCRHKAYEQTESFKAKRREYMREYYALKNSGKVK